MAGRQAIVAGFPFPVYINETGARQAIAAGPVYINESVQTTTPSATPTWFSAFNENPPPQSLLIAC